MFRADLHCHTTASDGSDSPEKVIDLALACGLSALSFTDHDTLGGYDRGDPYACKKNFPLLSGIEFSASHRGEAVHVLGYAFPLTSEPILALCAKHVKRCEERNRKILAKLQKLGITIQEEELRQQGEGILGRPHIAMLLVKRGIVSSLQEAFQHYLGEGKGAYDPGEKVSIEETIATIQQGKGKAILAHPHLIAKNGIVRELLAMPFDGLEGYYGRMHPQEEERWIREAQKRGWIITGGSDYHGIVKPHSLLGSSWVNQETFEILYGHYREVQRPS